MPGLRLNKKLFKQYMQENELTIPKISEMMGLNRTFVYKVLEKDRKPGRKFIEGALKVMPYKFEDLFF